MELIQGLVLATLACCACLIYYKRRAAPSPPLPPGPAGLPILGSLPFLDPELHTYFAGLAKTHGPICTLKLGSKLGFVVSSPNLAREVLRDNDAVFANRDVPTIMRAIPYGSSDIVCSPNGPTLRMLRKVCVQKMLSPTSLDAVYHLRRREVRATMRRLLQSAGKPVDVGAQVFLSVLNVVTSMLWGGTVDASVEEESGGAVGFEFREVAAEITTMLGIPNMSDFFPMLARFDLQGLEKKMWGLFERFDRVFESMIEQRRKVGKTGAKDLLEFMLQLEAEGVDGNVPFTMMHVKALLMNMFVGGTDTTANTVEWVMAEMINTPETIKGAQEELDRIIGKDNAVEESHISKLPYLAAVIKEVLRLHPALPLLVPHCPSSSSTIGGYSIPQGSRVFVNVWAIHRDASIWDDPTEFKPERFLDTDKKWDFSGNDLRYFPFGAGRRICAGISMAERMTMYTVALLLHSFDWTIPEGTKLELSEKFGIVLKKAKPLIAIPTPRLTNLDLYS